MARKLKTVPKPTMARVIRDSRDGKKDYQLPADRARELYVQGVLQWDITNGSYCTKNPAERPE